ncbi:magnesium transporter CorA family protein [Anaeromicropila populeti]|uniref:Magnesium transporter n=1 Tax=Anaeromicropila populeti TaxID=37658 RepID=A0A1I6JPG7_9FIRM|nr:CorA family divalent cation transporter [Anaeromicropila populeti]SFR80856.1 magnesium transporter [Anaeromicropila populeti]
MDGEIMEKKNTLEKIYMLNELDKLTKYMNQIIVETIRSRQMDKFESHEKFILISFDWYDIHEESGEPAQIIIYYEENKLIFLCETVRCFHKVQQLLKEGTDNEHILYEFFAELIKGDIDCLEELEESITETEDELLTCTRKGYAAIIIKYRRELLRLKKYYEQLNYIFEGLVENENNMISNEKLRYFRILDNRIDRLFAKVLSLRDYVTQVREAYQAQIDIEQNNLMKIFTVVTTIFLPLTLIVGWYGMNLNMPEFSWKYGYPYVITLSIIICLICIIIFKKKKWF